MTHNPFNILIEKNALTGPNYVDWLRNLRIVLNLARIRYILEANIPTEPPPEASKEEQDVYLKWLEDDLRVRSYMLASMSSDLQSSHEKMSDARSVLLHLQELYGEHSRTARYEISRELFRAKMSEGGEVGEHVLKMISMIERLEALDFSMDYNLQVDLILQSLPDSFSQFIVNFNMNEIECTLAGLLNKLVSTQSQMKTKGKDAVALTISTSRPS
ncbi:uncharacterized protein LOC120271590 [Dioscorea cayenensis subsp. rotundata]|uniref:Uncharacterized protein LOC120271590 n=1 Tax=Dioscorea cayennensis subsp. rotundata TaxID=55577 RepID=A0AB40C3H5_DIOCR|nr:uncharacterized protein LOC120271590 [Dioscorea cayenensis subsp. rotundata]